MLYHKHGEKNNGRSKTVFFINQSHTEGYSYCKLSFSYITKRGEKTNKETTPNPQNAQTNQTKQNKTNRSVFCMKHFCVCNLFIMLNLVKHHKFSDYFHFGGDTCNIFFECYFPVALFLRYLVIINNNTKDSFKDEIFKRTLILRSKKLMTEGVRTRVRNSWHSFIARSIS